MIRGKRICEAEVRWLEQQLNLRRQLGKTVAVVGVSMGLAALTSCESQLAELDAERNFSAINQSTGSKVSEWMVDVVEHQPSFPGGSQALMDFLRENVKFPEQAKDVCFSGRVVVAFVVEKDGSITNPEIVRGIHPLLDAEALRVVGLMPKWEPGYQGDSIVRVKYNLPVSFKLDESPLSQPTTTQKTNEVS